MAKFAPVGPLSVLQQGIVEDNYYLLLAHDVVRNDHWHTFRDERPNATIIMDNSIIELGGSVNIDVLLAACSRVRANHLVLPDVLHDGLATVSASVLAAQELKRHVDQGEVWGFELAYVTQGKTREEVLYCTEQAIKAIPNLGMLCVPRLLVGHLKTRSKIIADLASNFGLPIHMLGFSHNIMDDVVSSDHQAVMGIDSAMPLWLGYNKRLLPTRPPTIDVYGPRPASYMMSEEYTAHMAYNHAMVKCWFS